MAKIRMLLNAVAVLVACLACSSIAQAQATRTWVSGVGDDVNPCSRTAPCKTYSGAISKTATGGEISTLDPGGFGTLTITKSITVEGTEGQGYGSILAASTTGVTINVTTNPTTSVVVLRNLSINGIRQCTTAGCQGTNGVRFLAGKSLVIDKCYIVGFATTGIDVTNSTANPAMIVQDTTIRDIGGNAVNIAPTSAMGVVITNSQIEKSGTGVSVAANGRVTIRTTNIAQNTTGINTVSGSETNVTDSQITGHTTGINVVAGATVRIGNNSIMQNFTGVANAGTVQTTQDNRLLGNPTPSSGVAFTTNPAFKQ